MSSSVNQYIRSSLRRADPPPAVKARFFYTSPIPIDDPLSPVPPASQGDSASKQPPKAFSSYDNAALDEAWHELRRKIRKYEAEQYEKTEEREQSKTILKASSLKSGKSRTGSASSTPATPRSKPVKLAPSSLGRGDGLPNDNEEEDVDAFVVGSLPDTTGNPFVRAPSRSHVPAAQREGKPARPSIQPRDTYEWDDSAHLVEPDPVPKVRTGSHRPSAKVAVGVSRLHQVEMPEMQMTPIYWTPVHDTAPVVRGTWFYQDTMLPVETAVANMLEAGYVDLRVWTDTWRAELNSAIEVGAVGEMKIVHKLWPDKLPNPTESRPSTRRGTPVAIGEDLLRTAVSALVEEPDTPEQAREKSVKAARDLIDIAVGPDGADNKAYGTSTYGYQGGTRIFANWGVIYANDKEARLLKPSLMPSEYYGRRPLASYIRKGYKLGIPVVRGFDQGTWNKLHPSKDSATAEKTRQGAAASTSTIPPNVRRKTDAKASQAEQAQVTDLVLVIHGIGQKWASRYENWHFTHAINSFRREINVELGSKEIRARLRKDVGSIMALPVNWRHSLSFEEGGYSDGDPSSNQFSLADITPESLPAVRNIVSDVMLDIPYYMSHHQPKMIAAVVSEANRVYQLWCRNNPGFSETGRVHLIAHSLGSVMAIDILSRQPTVIPESLADPTTIDLGKVSLDHFLFNTHNLYLAGSPAGFFLLLKKAQLLPRIDYPSGAAEADPMFNTSSICGERGEYGCIAVDNIYNIINPYDPVAYRMNAAVDAAYSASLKQAVIPSATPGWFGIGTKSSTLFNNPPPPVHSTAGTNSASHPSLDRLPSNVEMEIHNFSREEVAERRMYLLNDNGQIDFFLRYGGGTFEIQYLTMLGAHSSYWLLKDFVRMLVTETGRERGREGTWLGMRAKKKKKGHGGV